MKKNLSLMLAGIICLCALSGCSKQNKEKLGKKDNKIGEVHDNQKTEIKKELNVAVGSEIEDMNVHLYNGNMAMQNMVYEGLVKNTEKGPIPWLAEKWEISLDGTEYTFHRGNNGITVKGGKFLEAVADTDTII